VVLFDGRIIPSFVDKHKNPSDFQHPPECPLMLECTVLSIEAGVSLGSSQMGKGETTFPIAKISPALYNSLNLL